MIYRALDLNKAFSPLPPIPCRQAHTKCNRMRGNSAFIPRREHSTQLKICTRARVLVWAWKWGSQESRKPRALVESVINSSYLGGSCRYMTQKPRRKRLLLLTPSMGPKRGRNALELTETKVGNPHVAGHSPVSGMALKEGSRTSPAIPPEIALRGNFSTRTACQHRRQIRNPT